MMIDRATAQTLTRRVEEIIADFQKKNPEQVRLLLDVAVALIKEINGLT